MKKFSKILSVALLVALVLSLGVANAFAADGDPAYSITVTNDNTNASIIGKTYTAYKLFDLTYSGDNYAYSIKTDNPFYATANAKAVLDTYFDFIDTSDATVKTVVVKEAKQNDKGTLSAADVRALADALQPYATGDGAGSAEATSETVTINLPVAGYYIVTGTIKPNDPANSDKEVVSAVILDNADPTANVKPKASVPELNKKITGEHVLDTAGKAATAEVGKTVSFELDSKVPDLTGYTKYTYTISDTMSEGLTFTDPEGTATNDIAVTIGGTDKTSAVTIAFPTTQSFTVTIPFAVLQAATKGDAIVVTYSAVVNEKALTTDFEKNTAHLTYSHSPYDDETNDTPDSEVYVIDVNIEVDKIANGDTEAKLAGAEFVLFKGAEKPEDTASAWYKYDATNKKVTWVAKADADVFTTDANGKLDHQFQGLEAEKTGTKYGLLETKAPTGYNLMKDPIIVTLTGAYNDTSKTATITANNATVTGGTINVAADQHEAQPVQPVATASVNNQSGTQLPSTGGIGTTIFYVVGGVLVLAAIILLVTKKRMSE